MSNLRIAVIGADQLDPDHHTALNTLVDQGRISAFALDVTNTDDALEALAAAKHQNALDAIILAGTRTDLREWTGLALTQNWPVYSTYPIPMTIEDMVEIRRIEQTVGNGILQFGFTARHHESVIAARIKAESGEYGRLLSLRGVCGINASLSDDQLVFDHGAQLVDLMHAFAGPFQDISGFSDLDRTPEAGSETNVMATLRTHSGTLASLHLSATQWRPTFRLELGFERGYLWLEGLNTQRHQFGQEAFIYARTDGSGAHHETVDRFEHSDGAKAALDAFLARVRDPQAARIGTSQQAFDALNTIQRILAADPVIAPLQERHAS